MNIAEHMKDLHIDGAVPSDVSKVTDDKSVMFKASYESSKVKAVMLKLSEIKKLSVSGNRMKRCKLKKIFFDLFLNICYFCLIKRHHNDDILDINCHYKDLYSAISDLYNFVAFQHYIVPFHIFYSVIQ